jgi:transposase
VLGLPLDDPGFHSSVLSEFRARLLRDNAEHLLLDTLLDLCREVGLLKTRSKQRTDSTAVLATSRDLSRLEQVGETLRQALNRLARSAPSWLRRHADPTWIERYGHRLTEYHLPQGAAERQALAGTIGQDGYHLLEEVYRPTTPAHVRALPAIETLRRVWIHQYYRCDDPAAPVLRWRTTAEVPPSAQHSSSPSDPDARYKRKRQTTWIGYTVQCDSFARNRAVMSGG